MRAVLTIHVLLAAVVLAATSACSPAKREGLAAAGTPTDANMARNPNPADAMGTPGAGPINGNAPTPTSGIATLFPPDGAQTCPRPPVGVDLVLSDALRQDGSFDPSTVALFLDGRDVTAAAVVREAQTYPASRASILFVPPTDLALGVHDAAITYPGPGGAVIEAWSFTVASIPCP